MGSIKLNSIPYLTQPKKVIAALQSDSGSGLSSSKLVKRSKEYGKNKIEEKKTRAFG